MKKFLIIGLMASFLSLFGVSAFAVAPTTISELIAGINFLDVTLGLLNVAGLLISVYFIFCSARFILRVVQDDDYHSGKTQEMINLGRVADGNFISRDQFETLFRDRPDYRNELVRYAKDMTKRGKW